MPYVHHVSSLRMYRSSRPILPKLLIQTAPREYTDRDGTVYVVVWNGQRDDCWLCGDPYAVASSTIADESGAGV